MRGSGAEEGETEVVHSAAVNGGGGPARAARLAAEAGIRLGSVALLLLAAGTVVFFLIHLVPGDPAAAMLGEGAAPADVAALKSALGLDRPVHLQYVSWVRGLLRGDLGRSILSRKEVAGELLRAFPATLGLALAAFAAGLLVAVPAGVGAALTRGSALDQALRVLSLAGVSTPNYVSGPLLVLVFSVGLELLPVSGRDGPGATILPAATLGLTVAALLARMIRASLLDELDKPYVLAARARGEGRLGAALRHAGRNALAPVLVVAGLQFGSLLTGAVVTETIFSWPGIGRLLVQSIQRRDYPMVQGCVLFIAVVYVAVNALVDLLAGALDPRAAARAREEAAR